MKLLTSDFYCTQCGKKGIPVIRKENKCREAGHLKKLFCIYCKTETNHCEIRQFGQYTYQDFLFEFNYHNFSVSGQRIKKLSQLRHEVRMSE